MRSSAACYTIMTQIHPLTNVRYSIKQLRSNTLLKESLGKRTNHVESSTGVPESAAECFTLAPAEFASPMITVLERFETLARQRGNHPAVESEGRVVTYRQLNAMANRVAEVLKQSGVERDSPVAICLQRSVEMVAVLLGIWKAGGAYLPLDPHLPKDRMHSKMEQAQVKHLITEQALSAKLPATSASSLSLEQIFAHPPEPAAQDETTPISESQLAYIIFTSGSTGNPKGVALEHLALAHFVEDAARQYKIGSLDRVMQFASLNFDAHVEEIFVTLAHGATLVLRTEELLTSYAAYLRFCEQQRITAVSLPTAYWQELTMYLLEQNQSLPNSLRTVVIGGEEAQAERVRDWFRIASNRVNLFNTYGPTEASVVATVSHLSPDKCDPVPIGIPMGGKSAYILNERYQPVPAGESGELFLGGPGLARGYIHQPELTQERFVPDPFSTAVNARMYRTGDRVRRLPSGELAFLGRTDHQVKLRGFRIELGEIEKAIEALPGVRQAVVLLRGTEANQKRLVAYIVSQPATQLTATSVRQSIAQRLPEYMVPAAYMFLPEFPLNLNCKVDRHALPEPPESSLNDDDYVAPRTELETQLATIWQRLLKVPRVGIHDNFFHLGGHSLLAARMFTELEPITQHPIALATLFEAPTIAALADRLQSKEQSAAWPVLVPIQPHGSKRIIFCVHGIGGNVLGFEPLSRYLGSDQPMYGLQARGLDQCTPPHTQVEAMAADYIREMRTLQPHGPYQILGQSFGGLVAFEMARQLQAQGEQVALLGLLDTIFTEQEEARTKRATMEGWKFQFRRLRFHLSDFYRSSFREKLAFVGRKYRTIHRRVRSWLWRVWHWARAKRSLSPAVAAASWNVTEACWMAAHNYVPRPYQGSITLFRAAEYSFGDCPQEHGGWQGFAEAGVTTHHVPGDHLTMLQEPHIATLAAAIEKACLSQADTTA
jgi:aspartate racemase